MFALVSKLLNSENFKMYLKKVFEFLKVSKMWEAIKQKF